MSARTFLMATVSLVIGLGAVSAQPMSENLFTEKDSNGDGMVTHAEMLNHTQQKFDGLDGNHDGFIALDELPEVMDFPAHVKPKMKTRHETREKSCTS